jgi:hypothetical protein
MFAGTGSGHIKATQALKIAFAADDRVAEVINNDALKTPTNFSGIFIPNIIVQIIHRFRMGMAAERRFGVCDRA